jgi:hypothetical protein
LMLTRRFCRRNGLCLAKLQRSISSSHLQALAHRHLHCWKLDMMIHINHRQSKRKCLLLTLSFDCHFTFLHICSWVCIYLFWTKYFWNHSILTLRLWEQVSTKLAGLGTTYDVTSEDDSNLWQKCIYTWATVWGTAFHSYLLQLPLQQ